MYHDHDLFDNYNISITVVRISGPQRVNMCVICYTLEGAITNLYTRAAAIAMPRGISQPVQPLKPDYISLYIINIQK